RIEGARHDAARLGRTRLSARAASPPLGDVLVTRAGRWLVFGATFFWGTSATLARFVFRDQHVPPLTVVELRLWFSAIPLGLWLALRRPELLRVERKDWGPFLILGVFGLAA